LTDFGALNRGGFSCGGPDVLGPADCFGDPPARNRRESGYYPSSLRFIKPAMPSKPVPNNINEPGSGTVVPPPQSESLVFWFYDEHPVLTHTLQFVVAKPPMCSAKSVPGLPLNVHTNEPSPV
jgi:hypothetical protein